MNCYFPRGTMLWFMLVLQFIFYMAGGCFVEERIALMRIRSSLVEAKTSMYSSIYIPDSWGRSDNCCSWKRVTCNNSTRVSDLNLYFVFTRSYEGSPGWNLNLTIFSSFPELQLLDLSENYGTNLHGFDGLQGLTKLQYLKLSNCNLIGNNIWESLGKLVSLEIINFSSANLSRANTAFTSLQYLNLSRNQLNGNIPASLFELPLLEYLDLSGNQLNGSIPSSLFELPLLKYLDLSGNLLRGHIPTGLSPVGFSSSLEVLRLSRNNLNGTFDFFWLRLCTNLFILELSGNHDLAIDVKFHRSVPPFQLEVLMLSGCNLDNSIIEGSNFLGTQHHLQILDLSNNNLAGSIPTWILENVVNLNDLNLANNLLEGSLDQMCQKQSNLVTLNVSRNRFVGQLPTNISSVFPNLKSLDTSHNIISGNLPSSLCKLWSLDYIDMSNNSLTGEVPTCLFTPSDTSTMILTLKLSNNKLGGPIFGGASNLSSSLEIYLDGNNFEGPLPNNLSGPYLTFLDLHGNKLTGEFDVSFWNLTGLQVLSVASNSLAGGIYPAICNLAYYLEYLDLSSNNFTGSLPNCDLTLKFLNMSSNSLSGSPGGFFNSSYVVALDLRYNQFKGSVDWIQHLSQTKMLLLGGNKFEGTISWDLCHLQYLNIIDLSHNKLSGSLPPCIGSISFGNNEDDLNIWSLRIRVWFPDHERYSSYDLEGFTFSTKGSVYTYSHSFFSLMSGIDLSGNMLSGEIPWEIGNLSHVKSLNLSHNSFTGPIPAAMGNMSAIESLDLSHNKLSGPIPWQLTHLSSLEVFSVAYNNLMGCIPNSGQFSFSGESYQGNTNLHNLSQGNSCFPAPGPMEQEDVGEASDDPGLYIITAASFVFSFWVTVGFLFCHPFGQRVVLQL